MRQANEASLKQLVSAKEKLPVSRKNDYGVSIIQAIESGIPARITGNMKNSGLITNLLSGCCVEVPCLADREGLHPCYVGDLPPQLAGLNRTNINVQELAVRGIEEKDKTKIFQSILLDPLTAAVLTIDETRNMVEEMFRANGEFVKGWK
jgi:alpha-galactosidase